MCDVSYDAKYTAKAMYLYFKIRSLIKFDVVKAKMGSKKLVCGMLIVLRKNLKNFYLLSTQKQHKKIPLHRWHRGIVLNSALCCK